MRAENVLAVQEAQCDGEAAARSAYQEGRVRRAEGDLAVSRIWNNPGVMHLPVQ